MLIHSEKRRSKKEKKALLFIYMIVVIMVQYFQIYSVLFYGRKKTF